MSIHASKVSWGVRGRLIVDEVSIEIGAGETVGLLGPNGSGKSSLLRLIAGVRPLSSGVIRLGDDDLDDLTRRQLARRLAVVDQQVDTDQDPRVRDVIALGRVPHRAAWAPMSGEDRRRVEEAAQRADVSAELDRFYGTLSGGERQRVQIARALAQEPTELLLDEPTNHLDIRHQLELLELVTSADLTVVMALHDLNLAARYCDRVVVLHGGRVHAAGRPADILTPALIAQVYGVEAEVDASGEHVGVSFVRPVPR